MYMKFNKSNAYINNGIQDTISLRSDICLGLPQVSINRKSGQMLQHTSLD